MKHYIITSVLSEASTHDKLLKNIHNLGTHLGDCALIGIPTGAGNVWDFDQSCMAHGRIEFDGFAVMGDLRVRPTVLNPLSGVLNVARSDKSQIFGATQIACTSLSRPMCNDQFRGAFSTGTVSRLTGDTYPSTNPGVKARFNHSLGFCVVSSHRGRTWVRPVYATAEGSFCFEGEKYHQGEVSPATYQGAVFGDVHLPKHHPKLVRSAVDYVKSLGINTVVLNDLLNVGTDGHHSQSTSARLSTGWDCLTSELEEAKKHFLGLFQGMDVVNLRSNHNEHGDKWLDRQDVRTISKQDLPLWFEYNALRCLEGTSFMDLWIQDTPLEEYDISYRAHDDKHPFRLGSYDCLHGDKGLNGSKGSITQFSRYINKVIFGHTHSFAILHGATNVPALCEEDQGYNNSITTWASGLVLVDEFDKRHLVVSAKGRLTPWG